MGRWDIQIFGATSLQAMDASSYEGAEILQDLNLPIPANLHHQFDTVFDGGTIEHVFDIAEALRNVSLMVKPGGLFVSINAANNQLGHGLYQFSPEIFWRYFSTENGFEIEAMYLAPFDSDQLQIAFDPAKAGKRLEIGMTSAPTYICFVARKTTDETRAPAIIQSDYAQRWGAKPNIPEIQPKESLTVLANRYGSDKGTVHGSPPHKYTYLYDLLLNSYRASPINLLEIGLAVGGPEIGGHIDRTVTSPSVQMWLDYFPQAEIFGFDISDFSHMKNSRFHFTRGDSGSVTDLTRVANLTDGYNIILDDGSHASYHQQLAFKCLFPKLRSGGVYIIEDVHWQSPTYEGKLGQDLPKTAAFFIAYLERNEYLENSLLSEYHM